ncbi:MAG: RNA 2',3'-cyclic phosphodiesterase [Nitrospirota bacterium]|nr:MAG: RNA 2',3'-cyclic phosphodiesterase [Nitrospirota bacterium]
MIRVFWAIELNQEVRSALREFQDCVRNHLPSIGWIRPESLHLTVKFLGEVDEEQLAFIQQAVEHGIKDCSPFSLQVESVGGFPNMNQPRVLWAGVSGQVADLQRLVSHVEEALIPLGFPSESKGFRGHLTLARIKQGSREVGRALARSQTLDPHTYFGMLQVHQLCLFRSELKPTGAVYHRLAEIQLMEN